MSRLAQRLRLAVVLMVSALLVQGVFLYWMGARINTSSSIPLGLYWRVQAPISKDAYVMFCPPQVGVFEEAKRRGYIGAGFCAGGYGYVMKKVVATTNDDIEVAKDGVRVNGKLLALSKPLMFDNLGRPMARFQSSHYVLSEHQLLLMGDANAQSFDGRYFGPIQRQQVQDVIRPVVTWGAQK